MHVKTFNSRQRHEKLKAKAQHDAHNFPAGDSAGFTLDTDFDDMGCHAHPDIMVAPGLMAHLGYGGGAVAPALERVAEAA